MQFSTRLFAPVLLVLSTALSLDAIADEEMDVDLADSPFIEDFHKDKDQSIKIWSKEEGFGLQSGETKKVYEENAEEAAEVADSQLPPPKAGAQTTDQGNNHSGKRYEIRELYSIGGSERTGYNPTTVVQALYLQMQGLCPAGWRKLDERSEPDGSDAFYMYYSFECL